VKNQFNMQINSTLVLCYNYITFSYRIFLSFNNYLINLHVESISLSKRYRLNINKRKDQKLGSKRAMVGKENMRYFVLKNI
jgi:hypothetical protein